MVKTNKPKLPEVVPNPQDEDFLWKRFLGLAYRTTRAILRGRQVVGEGQPLASAAILARDITRATFPIDPSDPVVGVAGAFYGPNLPAYPLPTDPPAAVTAIAGLHGAAAIELGIDPEDPVLFWFDEDQIAEHLPHLTALLDFEHQMLTYSSRKLVLGKLKAKDAVEQVLGRLHTAERVDYQRLSFSPLVEASDASLEEERALMVARLENVARRARQSLDIRTELATYRSISQILGLTFQDADQTQRHMRELFSLPPPSDDAPAPRRIQISSPPPLLDDETSGEE